MSIFRNINDDSFVKDFKNAFMDAMIEIMKKIPNPVLLNQIFDNDKAVEVAIFASSAFKDLLSKYGIEILKDNRGYYVYGYVKNIFGSRMPLGGCYERFGSEVDAVNAIMQVLSESRLGAKLEAIEYEDLMGEMLQKAASTDPAVLATFIASIS
jgi:hypothetical protein